MDDILVILRDRREARKKCSLTPLRGRPGIRFVAYHPDHPLDARGMVLLHPDGEELTDADRGLVPLLLDCSWRRVSTLRRMVDGHPPLRRLPPMTTAYPRRGRQDPDGGLASIEAAYAAVLLLAPRSAPPPLHLLRDYTWAAEFLRANTVDQSPSASTVM